LIWRKMRRSFSHKVPAYPPGYIATSTWSDP
jgi:hypothetical protein